MSAMQAEVYQAFRSIDVPEDKALRAAEALSAALATRDAETQAAFDDRDKGLDQVRAEIGALTIELRETRHLVEGTRSELREVREVVATKDALASLAANAATKADLHALAAKAATKADLDALAARAAMKTDLDALATKADLDALATRAAMKTDLDALATKADLDALRAESKADITFVKLDLAAVKGDVALLKWMMGFVLAAEIPILFKLFSH